MRNLSATGDFAIQEWDSETGLHYYRARYYDWNVGRFLGEDPMGFTSGYNFFAYVGNKPIQFNDSTGLFPTKFHRDMTYDAARAAFGAKCEPLARIVAQANGDQDALNGVGEHLKFAVGVGDGWSREGIHFGGGVDQSLHDAFTNCDDKALGKGLHGVQDGLSHSGPYASPGVHYWTSMLGYLTLGAGGFNPADSLSNFSGVDAATDATNTILRQYQRKCLSCCVGSR